VVGAATLQGSTLGAIGFNGSNEPDAPPVTRVGPVRFVRFFGVGASSETDLLAPFAGLSAATRV
jgi:hypothetical protein